jgi:glycosyltransferase involved in cell wall biosynthesis
MVGSQMNVREFLAVADLVLACDRAAVEAMASGRAVFAMNAEGFASVIEPANLSEVILYRRGFREYSDTELQDRLTDLLLNNRKRYYFSCRGVELVARHFDIAKVTTELEEIYRSAVH